MGNIIDDIRANEDTFADRPFNEVDSLALAQLSYARMPVNVPRLDAEATDVDLAMAANVVHDLSDPGGFYARVAQILRPGGVLYVHEVDSSDDLAENVADPHALGKIGFSLYHCVPLAKRRPGVVPGAFFGGNRHLTLLRDHGFVAERHYAPSDPVNLTIVARLEEKQG